jgi:inosine/xanthosine triphosphatase
MIIGIGSRADSKVGAVGKAFSRYSDFWNKSGILGDGIQYLLLPKDSVKNGAEKFSGVSHTPLSLDETIEGAKNRAKFTFEYFLGEKKKCDFAVGIEGGCTKISGEYYMTGAAVIFDGKNFFVGVAPAVPMPNAVMKPILEGKECGNLGEIFGIKTLKGRDGIVKQLTDGRIVREEFEELAVIMALVKIISAKYF